MQETKRSKYCFSGCFAEVPEGFYCSTVCLKDASLKNTLSMSV